MFFALNHQLYSLAIVIQHIQCLCRVFALERYNLYGNNLRDSVHVRTCPASVPIPLLPIRKLNPASRISRTPNIIYLARPRGERDGGGTRTYTPTPLQLRLHSTPSLHRHPPTSKNTETGLPRAANPLQIAFAPCIAVLVGALCCLEKRQQQILHLARQEESNFLPGGKLPRTGPGSEDGEPARPSPTLECTQ